MTALIAVIVSPIVSIYVAKRQIRASVVSTSRQKWIDSLRDQLAEFIAAAHVMGLHRGLNMIETPEFNSRLEQLRLIESKVLLLLNPNEADHKVLAATIGALIPQLFGGDELSKRKVAKEALPRITEQSQSILKREWERLKRGY